MAGDGGSDPGERTAGRALAREDALALDAVDPLGDRRDRFVLPEGVIYLDGNSLGPLPRATPGRIEKLLRQEWGDGLIRSWNDAGWIDLPIRLGDKVGRLVGAGPGQVVVADSTSVNLFKALSAGHRMRPGRRVVVSEPGNFPTDLYMVEGLSDLLGGALELRLAEPGRLAEAIDETVAVVMLTQVDYRTGALHDMSAVTRMAHAAGALAIWDLAHSAGAVPVDLDGSGADLAVGCGYKYLNGGPGAPAFLYVASRHQQAFRQPLSGWMGHRAPFSFDAAYEPAPGIRRALCGTPAIVAMAALESGVDELLAVDMAAAREKALSLTGLFRQLVHERCRGVEIVGPTDPTRSGNQVSLRHAEGYTVVQALIARGVIGDFRAPDLMRFGFAPLYVGHAEVWDAVEALRDVLETRAWDRPEFRRRAAVT